MLRELSISNFILIDSSHLWFKSGLSVFTGETGAGKSMVMEALKWLLGGRGSSELVRRKSDTTVVEAMFEWVADTKDGQSLAAFLTSENIPIENPPVSPFAKGGKAENISSEGGKAQESFPPLEKGGRGDLTLLVRREASASGKSRALVNGKVVATAVLTKLGPYIIDITNQDGQQVLLKPMLQRLFLDAASPAIMSAKEVYRRAWQDYQQAASALAACEARYGALKREEDYITYQLTQLAPLRLDPEEEQTLLDRKQALKSIQVWKSLEKDLHALLDDPHASFLREFARFTDRLRTLAEESHVLENEVTLFSGALIGLREGYQGVSRYLAHLGKSEDDLDALESTLSTLKQLQRKYHMSLEDLARQREVWQEDMAWLADAEGRLKQLRAAADTAQSQVVAQADIMSQLRRREAALFRGQVEDTLRRLGMPKVKFEVAITSYPPEQWSGWSDEGADHVQFLLSANPGQPLKPLAKVASGGELSRTLLAIKSALRAATADAGKNTENDSPLYVFDEIDTGIGGPTADLVGKAIADMARHCQIFCITHLPQVAQYGTAHYVIEKTDADHGTVSTIRALTSEERSREIARMLGGEAFSQKTHDLAKDILNREKRVVA